MAISLKAEPVSSRFNVRFPPIADIHHRAAAAISGGSAAPDLSVACAPSAAGRQ
jgi:hypothetical protein